MPSARCMRIASTELFAAPDLAPRVTIASARSPAGRLASHTRSRRAQRVGKMEGIGAMQEALDGGGEGRGGRRGGPVSSLFEAANSQRRIEMNIGEFKLRAGA